MYVRQLILALLALACAAAIAAAAAEGQGPNPGPAPTTSAATTAAPTPPVPPPEVDTDPTTEHLYILRIQRWRHRTWHWQRVMGVRLTRPSVSNLRGKDKDVLRKVANKWHRLADLAVQRAHDVPHKWAWLCIHRYEGSWTDSGAPYYGGLQMDWGFMATYGSYLLHTKGPANNWTPLEQMWVAERAYESGRGFSPWPNTARACGLL